MRLIINFTKIDLVITFACMGKILNKSDCIILTGTTYIEVNGSLVGATDDSLTLKKGYLLSAASLYFDVLMGEGDD